MAVLTLADGEAEVAGLAAGRIAAIAAEAVRTSGSAAVALAGGSTPRPVYELLARDPWRDRVPWDRLHAYWSDERCVPPDHRDSNYGMAHAALLAHVPLPAAQIHRIQGELEPEKAARAYERILPARVQLLLLGIGADAHVASIFPGSPLLREGVRRVAATLAPDSRARVTLTPPALLAAERILVIASGSAKADAVAAALEGPHSLDRWPAQLLRAAGDRVEWLIDRAAARALASPRA